MPAAGIATRLYPKPRSNVSWPPMQVKVGLLKTNKPFTLCEHPDGSFVSCLAASRDGSAVLSGHADGSIYVFRFNSGGAGGGGKLAQHSCMPSALAWGTAGIAAVGADSKVGGRESA